MPNNTYYFTFTILGWKKLFEDNRYCQPVIKWFNYCRDNYGNKIQGYVIMPDHIHLMMHLAENSPKPSILIMNAKRFIAYEIVNLLKQDNRIELLEFFNMYARTRFNAHHKIFTDGYDSLLIQSEKFFLQKLNYIHFNPIKAGLVKEIEDYPYSSASNYLKGEGYYNIDIVDF